MVIIHSGQRLTRLHNDAPGDCRGRLLLLLILLLFYMSLKPHEQHVLSPSERTLSGGEAVSTPPPSPSNLPPPPPLVLLLLPLLPLLLPSTPTYRRYPCSGGCYCCSTRRHSHPGQRFSAPALSETPILWQVEGRQAGRQAGRKAARGGCSSCLCLCQVIMFALIRLGAKDTNLEVMSKILCNLSKCIIKMLQCVFNINSR